MFEWEIKSKSSNLLELKDNLIKNRNIDNYEEFINPKDPVKYINDFSEDFLENVRKSKELIFQCIGNGIPIVIHGDYDADGVISTYLLLSTIKEKLNYLNVFYLIPDRFEDGYGLSDKTVKKILNLVNNQNFLLITVDCGITSISQVEYLKSLGNKVIITDHHHHGESVPNSDTLIWSDKVVGSTLSWILCLALGNKDPKLTSLIATATITDVFPLKGINRAIVKKGIEIIKKDPFYPFKRMLDNQGINLSDIGVYHLGFVIGPRLNSSGRIADADLSISLLNSKNDNDLDKSITEINLINQRRQKYTEDSLKRFNFNRDDLPKIIILKDEEFHEGVVGLIASKIVQTYNRPALVITKNEDFLKGSARSIKGINIIEIIKNYSHLLKGCGGHELAAGFSLEIGNYEEFKRLLENHLKDFDNSLFKKKIKVDSEILSELLSFELEEFINLFAPFGPENEEPILLIKNFHVIEINKIGKEKNHLSLKVKKNEKIFKALYFNLPGDSISNYIGQEIDLVFRLKKNFFNNKTNLDLHILDMKESG